MRIKAVGIKKDHHSSSNFQLEEVLMEDDGDEEARLSRPYKLYQKGKL